MAISLASLRSSTALQPPRILMHGVAGIGKSTFAAKADAPDRIIAAFKRQEIRALASMGVLTTGFNAPAVDLIAMLRPTGGRRSMKPATFCQTPGLPRHRANQTCRGFSAPASLITPRSRRHPSTSVRGGGEPARSNCTSMPATARAKSTL